MFQPGEVFKTLWPEPAPGIPYTVGDHYIDTIFVHFLRFIVIANDSGRCTCVLITTYENQGLKKNGVDPQSHGIVYESSHRSPQLLQGEPTPGFPPIRVHIYEDDERIHEASRVCYAKFMTVMHDIKVLFIGRVATSDWDIVTSAMNACWARKDHGMRRRRR